VLLQYLGKQKNENCVFHLNAECCFANRHTKCIHIITWSRLNHSSFSQESIVCTKQDPGSEYSMLPSVTTHSSFTKSWCQSLCQKWELFFVEPQVKSQWIALVGYLTISKMLAVIKHVVDNNIICLSATKVMHQCMMHETLFNSCYAKLSTSFRLSYMAPRGHSWTELSTRFRKSTSVLIWVAS